MASLDCQNFDGPSLSTATLNIPMKQLYEVYWAVKTKYQPDILDTIPTYYFIGSFYLTSPDQLKSELLELVEDELQYGRLRELLALKAGKYLDISSERDLKEIIFDQLKIIPTGFIYDLDQLHLWPGELAFQLSKRLSTVSNKEPN
jgi:hypothetical protein